jgi:capsular exopolysaccharide synthesis family protein
MMVDEIRKDTLQTPTATMDKPAVMDRQAATAEKSGRRAAAQVMEAYKMIRTNLLFSLAPTSSRVVVFSSAEPSAGKSTLSANLAIVMAQTGARVLLIDADMRKPAQHHYFNKTCSVGLSSVLGGLSGLAECIHEQVKPNVDLITAGPIPPNPSELLGSARMQELLEKLQNHYDYVFIDMPPLCVVADALVVAPHTAGVILAARRNQTEYDEFSAALEKVQITGAKLLGVVLTDTPASNGHRAR